MRQKNREINETQKTLLLIVRNVADGCVVGNIRNQEKHGRNQRRKHKTLVHRWLLLPDRTPAKNQENSCQRIKAGIKGGYILKIHGVFKPSSLSIRRQCS